MVAERQAKAKPLHVPNGIERLPAGWAWTRLDDLCEGVFDCPHSTPKLVDAGPLVVRTQDILTGVFRTEQAAHVSEETYRERSARAEPRRGDLLYSREGTYFGIAAEVPEQVRVCLGQRMVLIRPQTSKADFRFLRHWLNSPIMAAHIHGHRDGSVAERLNLPTIRGLPVALPPHAEQRAIAHILGTLDDKIELNRRRNETLEAMARALFKDWFVDFGPVRTKMEGREPYLPADLWELFPERLDDESKPVGWETQPLSDLLTIIGGGTPKTSVEEYWGGNIPWFSVVDTPSASDVFVVTTEKTITGEGLAGSSARLIPKGTTIISARGTVGNLAIAGCEMTFNQSCYGLRGAGSAGDYFVYLTAQQMVDQLKSMAHGSVFSTITRRTFEAIPRPAPPPAVLTAFEGLVTGWFDAILATVEDSRNLAQLRDTLLPKLISGDLRIADVDAERFIATGDL